MGKGIRQMRDFKPREWIKQHNEWKKLSHRCRAAKKLFDRLEERASALLSLALKAARERDFAKHDELMALYAVYVKEIRSRSLPVAESEYSQLMREERQHSALAAENEGIGRSRSYGGMRRVRRTPNVG